MGGVQLKSLKKIHIPKMSDTTEFPAKNQHPKASSFNVVGVLMLLQRRREKGKPALPAIIFRKSTSDCANFGRHFLENSLKDNRDSQNFMNSSFLVMESEDCTNVILQCGLLRRVARRELRKPAIATTDVPSRRWRTENTSPTLRRTSCPLLRECFLAVRN